MTSTWLHPTLGDFTYDGIAWIATINMPAFKVLSYDTGYDNAPRSTGQHELAFVTDCDDEIPSMSAVALADKVLVNQYEIVEKMYWALWRDFTGEGAKTGMWWHGNFDEVAAVLGVDVPLSDAKDLLPLLQLSQMTVFNDLYDYKKPIIELSFHASFEEEHGVGLLTDGDEILGIGYSSDVDLFE